jgi:hypothetical protein
MPDEVERVMGTLAYPVFSDLHWLRDSGKGKVSLPFKAVEKLGVSFPVRMQTIGSCVAQGMACAIDVIKAAEIVFLGQPEEWVAETATEPIYAVSRVDVGKGRLGRRDGSVGAWAVEAVEMGAAIPRGVYGDVDLTTYSGEREREWGMPSRGAPMSLLETLRRHVVRYSTQVTDYDEARDAIANSYPVTVASNRGFVAKRDAEGFARPRGTWMHQMAFIAVDDAHTRPGLLCMNSWGPDWISGPKRHDQPEGSFWVDADTATKMLRQGDSFALSGYEGFPRQQIDWSLA